jgi:hypothetical protein
VTIDRCQFCRQPITDPKHRCSLSALRARVSWLDEGEDPEEIELEPEPTVGELLDLADLMTTDDAYDDS